VTVEDKVTRLDGEQSNGLWYKNEPLPSDVHT
jgi:hypothetical protein